MVYTTRRFWVMAAAAFMLLVGSLFIQQPASAHKTCSNNLHYHQTSQAPYKGREWKVRSTTQAGPNNAYWHWYSRFVNRNTGFVGAWQYEGKILC